MVLGLELGTSDRAGQRMQHAVGEWIFVPKNVYQKLRRRAPDRLANGSPPRPERIEPSAVGRRRLDNVVISPLSEAAGGSSKPISSSIPITPTSSSTSSTTSPACCCSRAAIS